MNPILHRFAIATGGAVFLVALANGTMHGVPLFTAIMRALIAMVVATIAMTMLMKYFMNMLVDFITKRMMEMDRDGTATQGKAQEAAPHRR